MQDFRLVIGLVGQRAAGKDTLCDFLARPEVCGGFFMHAIRVAVVAEANRRGIADPTTSQLQNISAEGKKSAGDAGYWAERTLELAAEAGHANVVINGIRNPAEIDLLERRLGDRFVLVGLTAPTMLRYERALARARAGDAMSLEDFLRIDDRDRGVDEPMDGLHSDRCMARVPFAHVKNNAGTFEEFHAWAGDFVRELWAERVERKEKILST